jgi:general secretion pathway protein B
MSFILEALKRSENERQRQTGPGLATAPAGATGERRPPWLVIAAALLVVNLAVLAYLLLRPDPAPSAKPADTAQEPAPRPSVTAPVRPATVRRDTPTLPEVQAPAPVEAPIDPAPVTRPATEVAAAPAAMPPEREVRSLRFEATGPASASADTAGARTPAPARVAPSASAVGTRPEPSDSGTREPAERGIPTVAEATLRGDFSGRPLHLDLHVYYDDPARRLVFINGTKYREGERLEDGLEVAEIVPEGVVLDDGGRRFLLPST